MKFSCLLPPKCEQLTLDMSEDASFLLKRVYLQSKMWITMCYHRVGCAGPPEHLSPPQSPFCFSLSGVNALIFVGLDRVANFDRVMQLEFGRGFTYNRPLRVNLLDLDFELAEQLVSNLAQAVLPCNAGGKPMAGSPAGLNVAGLHPLGSAPLPSVSHVSSFHRCHSK